MGHCLQGTYRQSLAGSERSLRVFGCLLWEWVQQQQLYSRARNPHPQRLSHLPKAYNLISQRAGLFWLQILLSATLWKQRELGTWRNMVERWSTMAKRQFPICVVGIPLHAFFCFSGEENLPLPKKYMGPGPTGWARFHMTLRKFFAIANGFSFPSFSACPRHRQERWWCSCLFGHPENWPGLSPFGNLLLIAGDKSEERGLPHFC